MTAPAPLSEADVRQFCEVLTSLADTNDLLVERLAVLEDALSEPGWQRITGGSDRDFSRVALRKICTNSRLAWLANPLIRRAVACQTLYVWGQGVSIRASHPTVDAVVQRFLHDPSNRAVLGDTEARQRLETELQVNGNLFFVFFPNPSTGAVKVRTIPFDEISAKICNPEDAAEPQYYLREWSVSIIDAATGLPTSQPRRAYYPAWRYLARKGGADRLPEWIGGVAVQRETPVYHVAVNRLGDMEWGVSEMYAAVPWAAAYKSFLENWATIVQALSRFAMHLTTKGGSSGVAAARDKLRSLLPALNSTLAQDGSSTPISPGGTFVSGEGTKLEPIKTSGITTSCDDARRLLLMVSSATGIFEHYLSGDPSTGNLATAKAMERPMELQFAARQDLWRSVLTNILNYVIDQAALAPNGPLSDGATVGEDDDGDQIVTLATDPETKEPMDRTVEVVFPSILEHDLTAEVDAVVKAATLGGQGTDAGVLSPQYICQALLDALGEEDAAQLATEWHPDGDKPTEAPPSNETSEAALARAIGHLEESLGRMGVQA